jgi:antitoxin HigA-1
MGKYFVNRPLKRSPVHPGEVLREDVLPALGLSVSEAARRLGISRQQLHRVLACTHPITTDMALRIGKFAGNGPGLWLRMQQAYDLWYAEHRMKDELSKIETVASSGYCAHRDRDTPHKVPLPHHAAYGSVLRDSADQAESDPGEHKPK